MALAGYSIRSGSGCEESSEESDEEDEGAIVVEVPSNVDEHGTKISVAPREVAVPADVVRDDPNDRTPAPPRRRFGVDSSMEMGFWPWQRSRLMVSLLFSRFGVRYTLTNHSSQVGISRTLCARRKRLPCLSKRSLVFGNII